MSKNHFKIYGPTVYQSKMHFDNRGSFREWFKLSEFQLDEKTSFIPTQANVSKSKNGTVRGIHFSLRDKKQSKLITCVQGKIFDVIVDLRSNSRTFGQWESKILSSESPESIYIPSGFGHGFQALEKNTIVTYLQTDEFNKDLEHSINPFDSELGINWPLRKKITSSKDSFAPTLTEFKQLNLLEQFTVENSQ